MNPIQLRHDIHQHPEIALEEHRTTKIIRQTVEELLSLYQDNLKKNSLDWEIMTPLETGFILRIFSPSLKEGPYKLFRADIDALPIKEETQWEYQSSNDYMHACGHDIHLSILVGTIEKFLQSPSPKNLLFLFQPAEEDHGGAERVIRSGVLDKWEIKKAYALHVTDEYELGTVASNPHILFTAAVGFDIEFFGEAGHIAFPKQAKDSFKAMHNFLSLVHNIPQDPINPVLFGIGKAQSGDVRNIYPAYTKIEGTMRGRSCSLLFEYQKEIQKALKAIEEVTGVKGKWTQVSCYESVKNTPSLYEEAKDRLAHTSLNFIECPTKMTGEDFGFFCHKYPSCMFWLGTRNKNQKEYGLHNPHFLPPDETIAYGVELFTALF